jgi:TPR repeat protein
MDYGEAVGMDHPLPPLPLSKDTFVHTTFPDAAEAVADNTRSYPVRHSSSQVQSPSRLSIERKPIGGTESRYSQASQYSPRRLSGAQEGSSVAQLRTSMTPSSDGHSTPSREVETPEAEASLSPGRFLPPTQTIPIRQRHIQEPSEVAQSHVAEMSTTSTPAASHIEGYGLNESTGDFKRGGPVAPEEAAEMYPSLQYHHQPLEDPPRMRNKENGTASPVPELQLPSQPQPRPNSTLTVGSGSDGSRGRGKHNPHLSVGGTPSPNGSPMQYAHGNSPHRYSPDSRPASYIDLLHVPYPQQVAPAPNLDNSLLRSAVGSNAALLATTKTLEMYRANVKKAADPAVQYEFAIFMVQTAMELPLEGKGPNSREEMLKEARQILHKLADRSYPFAQYYLGDGFASGLFNKGKEDYDRAFPLFVAASKHGHAEAGYRAALCYEFGWGCRKDYAKAAQFYRASASKNHPGAATRLGMACLEGTMGLNGRQREGIKWLKRAAESADFQYNAAPYELGRLHENGFGDDIFKDEVYAAQLFTQSADLGHPEANLIMGKAYEYGILMCPKDAALSIHFYNGAAQAGLPEAMMALCAWYLFGAEPVLAKDENEACEWAKRAADLGTSHSSHLARSNVLTRTPGYAKAEYAVGYFKEIGIGCRQDTLEANVWYVRAAQQGEERAKQRLAIIRSAASGGGSSGSASNSGEKGKNKKGLFGKLGLKE